MEESGAAEDLERNDRCVYDAYIAGRQGAALAAGVRSGLFDRLDLSPASTEELAEELGLAPRGLRALLRALVAMGLLREEGERYALTPEASASLVRDRPGSLWALIDMEVDHFLSPRDLLETLRTGRPSVYGGADPWDEHATSPERAAAFTRAMHSISEGPAAALAEEVELEPGTRLLDVGGGSGALSIAICRAHPGVHCTVLDLEPVCAVAREMIRGAGLAGAIETQPGDMFAPLPAGYDVLLFSQILHDWPPSKGLQLLRSAHRALAGGGAIWIHEKLIDDDGRGPLANALVDLDMAVWTEGQQYRVGELEALIREAGFTHLRRRSTTGYWSLVVGERP